MRQSKRKSPVKSLPRVVVVVGSTASGKTSLGIRLAKKFNGEIISADSRQIYRGMDIGTAKPPFSYAPQSGAFTKPSAPPNGGARTYYSEGVRHHLVDIRNPNQLYTVAQYKKDCVKTIKQVLARNKLPIMVGGTGLYIKAVTDNLTIPKVKADPKLRTKLEKEIKNKGLDYLYQKLIRLDPEAAYIIDRHNPRRIIRALEIALKTNKPFSLTRQQGKPLFAFLQIGISLPKEKLKNRIDKRVDEMTKLGLIQEVKNLIKKYPPDSSVFDAIGYREIINYLQGKSTLEEAVKLIKKNTWYFAKRQLTWFRKDKRIHWITTPDEAEKLTKAFLV
ncbi:MAG: tRNA (adenosine(37)-N6)-dimethylallyltransferase MiaA [Candidatus Colwellbacteria bacterium]|nr:tRNA (adenosine(37)-N6)-dimethylallyltransferase MiaA [Candidatus Colwellbacteria bacterium]